MGTNEQQRAAAMARQLKAGLVSWWDFAESFNESRDELVEELYSLLEHEPKRGGFLGVSERKWAQYQADIENAIRALERA